LEFRWEDRTAEYRDKLARNQLGFFAQSNGTVLGSIWATVNTGQAPLLAQRHVTLLPHEALVHDVVTGERFRNKGIGTFMVVQVTRMLFANFGVRRVATTVSSHNPPSLRMMIKAGFQTQDKQLSVSLFGRLVWKKILK
jgi:GNAT superfamily N-acetyltransferase